MTKLVGFDNYNYTMDVNLGELTLVVVEVVTGDLVVEDEEVNHN